ncbi:MAG: F5/8 type C domain protein [Actinobacteria bacterium ADurb.Bin444]|nr:MAG: F5/8 type C domain protein [Actinobacteria bacterium ADurb.Bin444]
MSNRAILPTLLSITLAAALHASVQSDIGYTELKAEFGSALPDGSNLTALVVEAPDGSGRWAVAKSGELSTRKITVLYNSYTPTSFSSHAGLVAKNLCGTTTSIIPSLEELFVTDIASYRAQSLKIGSGPEPITTTWDLENHSLGSNVTVYNINMLRRLDYRINRDLVTVVVALGNGTSAMEPLWGNNYNTIAVGTATGQHSRGGTNSDGSGRMKPDLVGTATYTSYATPVVTSAAGLLIAETKRTASLAPAKDPRVIKALLMAGATKEEFPAWARTPAQPLDPIYGAGQVNIYNSYKALLAGRQPAGAAWRATKGWDTAKSGASSVYYFEVPAGQTVKFSTVLAWHRELSTTDYWVFSSSLADLNLRLRNTTSTFALGTVVAESTSALDNVEHIYVPALPAGKYALEVFGPAGTTYGIAWNSIGGAPEKVVTPTTPAEEQPAPAPATDGELTPATYSARGENGTKEGVAKLFDHTTTTKWLDFSGTSWVQVSFGAPTSLTSYSFTSANDYSTRDPYNWTLSGSNDGVTWTVIETRSAQTFASRYLKRDFTLAKASAGYLQFRFDIVCKSGSITQLANLQVFGQATATTTETTPSTEPATSTVLAELAPTSFAARGENGTKEGTAKLFDHTASTKWLDFSGTTWIQVSFNEPRALESYSFTSANDRSERDPRNWTLSGSNDGVTWTVIESRTSQSFATRLLQRDFVLAAKSEAFKHYRFDIVCKSGSITQLADLELWGY